MSPQVVHKSAFVNTLVAFVKKTTSQCQWSLASHKIRIGFISLVVCFDLLGPKFLMIARQLKKEGWWRLTKCDSNGGHLHARKGEDQVQLPPDLPTAAAGCWQADPCCPSSVWPQLTFSLLISELFISIEIHMYFLSLSLPAANWGVWRFPKFHFHFSETIQMFSVARRPPHQ